MSKKAQGLPINVIIIAAIALAVLVVLFMIFTGRLGIFSKGLGEATNCQQACSSAGYKNGAPALYGTGTGEYTQCGESFTLPGYSIIDNGIRKSCCCSN